MAKLFLVTIFFPNILFAQQEKINIKNIFENNGLFYENFSEDVANGMVYQFDDDLELPLGIIKNGFKEGKWLEWTDKNQKIKTEESLFNKKDDIKKKHSVNIPSSLEIINYISEIKYNKAVLKLIFTQVINFDSSGSKMEESLKTYNQFGTVKRNTYRKYEYIKGLSGLIDKIIIFNDKNILIQKQLLNYDKNKMLIGKELFGIQDEIIDKTIYSYDSSGMLEKEINYDKKGKKNNSTTFNYDIAGNKNKELIQLFSSKLDLNHSIENYYSYDENGKVIKKENEHYITYYYYDQFLLAEESTYLVNSKSENDEDVILSKKIYNYY
tara:strand:- start:37 stop:1011 length:975 start_codon:yes stop_codon:yes gene_type:complete